MRTTDAHSHNTRTQRTIFDVGMVQLGFLNFLARTIDAYRDDLRIGDNDLPSLKAQANQTKLPGIARGVINAFRFLDLSAIKERKPELDRQNWAVRAELRPGDDAGFNASNLDLVIGPPSALHTDAVSLGKRTTDTNGEMLLQLGRDATGGVVIYENRLANLAHVEPYDVYVSKKKDGPYVYLGVGQCNPDGDRFYFGSSIDSARFILLRDRGESTGPNAAPCACADIKGAMGFDRA